MSGYRERLIAPAFPNHIFNIIGPWLLVLGAFVYVQYPTCTLRGLLIHESPGDMEPELPNDWRHRPWPRHGLLWGVRGNGKAGHNLRFHREEFPSVPARLFPEIRFRGYPKESMRIRFSGKMTTKNRGVVALRIEATPDATSSCPQTMRQNGTTYFQKGDESSSFVPLESTTNRVMEFLWVVYLSRE